MSSIKIRSADIRKELLGTTYSEEETYYVTGRLPTGQYLLGRMMALCKKGSQVSRKDAGNIVADEVRNDWISKNVYPISSVSVAKRIRDNYEEFKNLHKVAERLEKPTELIDREVTEKQAEERRQKRENFIIKVKKFNQRMTENAFDIRCLDSAYEKQLENEYGVKMTNDDKLFYEDNCHGMYIARCTNKIPRSWVKHQKRIEERFISEQRRKQENEAAELRQTEINLNELRDSLKESDVEMKENEESVIQLECLPPSPQKQLSSSSFPQVKVRHSKKYFNESLIRCIVHCHSKFKVTTGDLLGILECFANMVFDQKWSRQAEHCVDTDEKDGSDDEYEEESLGGKRRRKISDYTNKLPDPKTLRNYLEDAAYLNLEMVGRHVLEKGDNTVTIGVDDTTKAAGNRVFSVKTDHITIAGPSKQRETLTTGYLENPSHSGADAAITYEHSLSVLAVLTDSTEVEIKEQVDFWGGDRARDVAKMFDEMGINKNKIIKCCAHVVLGVDSAIEKIFKHAEQRVGVEKLIDCGKILRNSSSLLTVGLIALAKLLSPSHSAHSVSLYDEFVRWLEINDLDSNFFKFKGFTANRFGRIAHLAKVYLVQKSNIQNFFDTVVDANANKLVLAVSCFLANDWFQCCVEVYSLLGEIAIFPILDFLGIDKKDTTSGASWQEAKVFFDGLLEKLTKLGVKFSNTTTGKGKLIGAILVEVIEVMQRQLGEVDFLSGADSTMDTEKLRYAPLTNLGCESQFARLDNQLKVAGGMTTVKTHSRKSIIATNSLLTHEEFVKLSEDEKRRRWKWARNSEAVKKAKELEKEFTSKVKFSKALALKRKGDLNKQKMKRLLKIIVECNRHGGPVTEDSMHLVGSLNEKQLLSEIAYLRNTIAPDIRQKRRVKSTDGKYRFQNFTRAELKNEIKAVLKPEFVKSDDLDSLLRNVLCGNT